MIIRTTAWHEKFGRWEGMGRDEQFALIGRDTQTFSCRLRNFDLIGRPRTVFGSVIFLIDTCIDTTLDKLPSLC